MQTFINDFYHPPAVMDQKSVPPIDGLPTSPFLRLPLEIREMIYANFLIQDHDVAFLGKDFFRKRRIALAQQLRNETPAARAARRAAAQADSDIDDGQSDISAGASDSDISMNDNSSAHSSIDVAIYDSWEYPVCLFHLSREIRIFQVNKSLGKETADFFYSSNVFAFDNFKPWATLYFFLESIGEINRQSLSKLEVRHFYLTVEQHTDGTRTTFDDWHHRKFYPYDPAIHQAPHCFVEAEVPHIDPAIRPCLALLSHSGRHVEIKIEIDHKLFFRCDSLVYSTNGGNREVEEIKSYLHGAMELPKVIERCRRELNINAEGYSRVDIIWWGRVRATDFKIVSPLLIDEGWHILEVEEMNLVSYESPTEPTAIFQLRYVPESAKIDQSWTCLPPLSID